MSLQEEHVSGFLDEDYADAREKQLHLIFRYKTRALVVSHAVKKWLGISEGLRILDFGSAEGLTLFELRRIMPNGDYWGVEYSPNLLKRVREMPSDTRIIQGDVTDLPSGIDRGGFDVVCALAILEHLESPLKAVAQAHAALRPGGVFIATCPAPFWDGLAAKVGLLKDAHHIVDMDKACMTSLVRDAGFELLAFERFMWAPTAFLPYMKISISPLFSLGLDRRLHRLKLFDWLFVNQCIVARKSFEA